MKRQLIIFIIAFSLFQAPGTGYAVVSGAASTIQLREISETLKVKLLKTIKLLKEATIQSKTMLELRTLAINMKDNYEFIKNFDLEDYMQEFVDELKGFTLLENLNGKDFDRQFDLVMKEIDRRFTEDEERSNIKNYAQHLRRLWSLQKVKSNEANSIVRGEQSYGNNVATTASNTGLSLIYESQREARALTEERKKEKTMEFNRQQINNAIESMKIN